VVSEKIETLIADARKLAEQGTKELVITAMDVTQYGTDLNDKNALIKLLSELIKIEGFKWIRLLYLHPAHITDELICFIKGNPIIVPYFDVPIQHINDEILARMNRKMRREDIETVITKIRHLIPEAVLRTTLMTAFPGETEEQHKELMDFVRKTKFDRLGVFIYSKEEGTPAYAYTPSVNHRRALRRQRELMELHSDISEGLLKRFIGQELDVIVDGTYPQNIYTIEGRTKFDAPDVDGTVLIQTDKYKQYKPGDFIRARIIESREHDLVAELVEKNL
jgi:ribosomal protein S12 methylthiotransferase